MRQCEIAFADYQWEISQVIYILLTQLLPGPAAGPSSLRVEIVDTYLAYRAPVVISSHTAMVILTKQLDALLGVRAITDDVPQAPNTLESPPRLNILEHSLESGEIAVDVRDDCVAHITS
jgi:hypothetical protein